jgi:predicted HTH transcriptional regulator
LVNVASQNVYPSVFILTETVTINDNNVILIEIQEGHSKPYKDKLGTIYMKNGADKRRVTSNEEISRLLQASKILYADEATIQRSSPEDIDKEHYEKFIERKYGMTFTPLGVEFIQSLHNLFLAKGDLLTLAGLLIFSKVRHKLRPMFSIQCVTLNGQDLTASIFLDGESIFEGNMRKVFDETLSFINRNVRKIPIEEGFNSQKRWEIPYAVFEEVVVNALIHRDYFINSTIKVYNFDDRFEIVSPGNLPNSLTVDKMKNGISIARNPILQSLGQHVLPYKGLGTGVLKAISLYPTIEFFNDQDMERFIVTIKKPERIWK